MRRKRVYRKGTGSLVAGVAGTVLFGALAWGPLLHLLTGAPMLMRQGRSPDTSTTRLATPQDLGILVAAWSIFFLVSLGLALGWVNGYITADETGLRRRNLLGMETFQASWDEIARIDRKSRPQGSDVYVFHTLDGRELKLQGFDEADDLVHYAQSQSPKLPLTP